MNASYFSGKRNEQEEEENGEKKMWMFTAEWTSFSVLDWLSREVFRLMRLLWSMVKQLPIKTQLYTTQASLYAYI